jgi:hypothetical protein
MRAYSRARTIMTSDINQRENALIARCSSSAGRELLESLRMHPRYPQLMAQLEDTKGTIFEMDIQQALYNVVKESRTDTAE